MRARLLSVLALGGLLAACSHGTPSAARPTTPATTTTVPLKSAGLIPADPHLTTRIELQRTRVTAGTTISGTLIVTNTASAPIDLTTADSGCAPGFQIILGNSQVQQSPGFAAVCSTSPFLIPPGTTRLPVTVPTTYFGCISPGGSSTTAEPVCVHNQPPPLPRGHYKAVLAGSGQLALPEAPPVIVTLT